MTLLLLDSRNKLYFEYWDSKKSLRGTDVIPEEEWVHLVWVQEDPVGITIYLTPESSGTLTPYALPDEVNSCTWDAAEPANNCEAAPRLSTDDPPFDHVRIGGSLWDDNSHWKGKMKDVLWWGRALSLQAEQHSTGHPGSAWPSGTSHVCP